MKKHYFLRFGTMAFLMMIMAWSIPSYGQLYINEFMASNDGAFPGPQGDYPDWIEIYNAGSEAVNLGGYYMSDKQDIAEAVMIPSTYPDSVTVEAGGFIVFYANNGSATSVMNLDFKLSGSGEFIGLWNTAQEIVDSLSFGEQTADVSYGRFVDGTDNWYFMSNITPGAANQNPAPAPVLLSINEFMASNDNAFPGPQGDYPDWIEIYNAGTEAVNLGGYYLSDDLTDPAKRFRIPDTYPDSVTIPSGGFLVFYANDDTAWSVRNTNFKLSGGGEEIGLWNADQVMMDSVIYMEQFADTSFGRYTDGTDNWYFMPQFTPGAENIWVDPTPMEVFLYINEFMASNDNAYPGPQGDYPDWIEIYNGGAEAVNLGGYYLSDDLSDPASRFQIPSTYPDSVTVLPGEFIVFYANDDAAWSVLNVGFKLSGSGEQIGLWNADMAVIDTLTYGAQIADTSYGRYHDGTDNWYMMPDFSPWEANRYTSSIEDLTSGDRWTQLWPNPFNQTLSTGINLQQTEEVTIEVMNINGTIVAVPFTGQLKQGYHELQWDSQSLPAGMYFYSVRTHNTRSVHQVVKVN